MTFTSLIKTFAADESGAVTVDWVVLTAAIVGLGLAVVTSVRTGVGSLGTSISNSLSSASVATLGTLGTTGVAPSQ
jgi:Flp pilus assembly pilin Flp